LRSAYKAIIGAIRPVTRLNAEHNASPVPLWGAGNTSGVYAYNTPYIAFWVKDVTQLYPSTLLLFVAVVKTKRKMPVSAVETAMASFLPPMAKRPFPFRVQSTAIHARILPGIPSTEMIE